MPIADATFRALLIMPALGTGAVCCETSSYSETSVAVRMTVRSGETCSMPLSQSVGVSGFGTMSGVNARQFSFINGIKVKVRALRGQAGVAGRANVAYVAPAAYKGPDSFVIEIDREGRGQQDVRFEVDVQ